MRVRGREDVLSELVARAHVAGTHQGAQIVCEVDDEIRRFVRRRGVGELPGCRIFAVGVEEDVVLEQDREGAVLLARRIRRAREAARHLKAARAAITATLQNLACMKPLRSPALCKRFEPNSDREACAISLHVAGGDTGKTLLICSNYFAMVTRRFCSLTSESNAHADRWPRLTTHVRWGGRGNPAPGLSLISPCLSGSLQGGSCAPGYFGPLRRVRPRGHACAAFVLDRQLAVSILRGSRGRGLSGIARFFKHLAQEFAHVRGRTGGKQ